MTDQQLLSSFRHEPNGDWTCIKPALFEGSGRKVAVLPGMTIRKSDFFLRVDIARELDEAEERQAGADPVFKIAHH